MEHHDIRLVEQLAALELNDSEREQLGIELDSMLAYLNIMDGYNEKQKSHLDSIAQPFTVDSSPYRVFKDAHSYIRRAPEHYRNWILVPNVL